MMAATASTAALARPELRALRVSQELTAAAAGPPHIYALGGLLKAICHRGDKELDPVIFANMTNLMNRYEAMTVTKRAEMCKVCRTDKMWRADSRRLSLCIADGEALQELVAALVAIGATRKQGRAPATYMERELQEYVEALAI